MEDLLSDLYVEPKLATIGRRMGAALIDFSVLTITGLIFGAFWGERDYSDSDLSFKLTGAPAFFWFLTCFLLMTLPEGINGNTLGQRVLKIKVVQKETFRPSLGSSIVRHLFDFIDYFLLIGIIIAASNEKRQRIGDLVAGTIVIEG
jgi:uncharacterized RDD family membrane protein YckC